MNTKHGYIVEAAYKLRQEKILLTDQDEEAFKNRFMRLNLETVSTFANLVRYNFSWLWGYLLEGKNYQVQQFRVLCNYILKYRPDLATSKPWKKAI